MARVFIAAVQARVCERFAIARREMLGPYREQRCARPRQVAMYLAYGAGRSRAAVGRGFGRDRKTVYHACRLVERLCADDPAFAATVRELAEEFPQREPMTQLHGSHA